MGIAFTLWVMSVIVTLIAFVVVLVVVLLKSTLLGRGQKERELTEEARQSLEDARAKADEIVSEAKHFNEAVGDQIANSLAEVSEASRDIAKHASNNIAKKADQEVNKYFKQNDGAWHKVLNDFRKTAHKDLDDFRTELAGAIKREVKKIRQDIRREREAEKKKTVEDIKERVPGVIKEITGRSIPVEIHEDLVREALVKAKSDEAF